MRGFPALRRLGNYIMDEARRIEQEKREHVELGQPERDGMMTGCDVHSKESQPSSSDSLGTAQ